MVNVQPSNSKLVDRAHRVISTVAGVSPQEAARLLEASGLSVRTAIVMGKLGLSRDEAESRLAAASGRLRDALARPASSTPGPAIQ